MQPGHSYAEPGSEFGFGGAVVRNGVMSELTADWRRQTCVADLYAVLGGKEAPHRTQPGRRLSEVTWRR